MPHEYGGLCWKLKRERQIFNLKETPYLTDFLYIYKNLKSNEL